MINTVIAEAATPNGRSVAVLIQRYRKVALSNDVFYLILVPANATIEKAINAEDIYDSAVFVATSADKVTLRWDDDATLHVLCAECGLRAIDIMVKREHPNKLRVVYEGFPSQTAYD